MMTQQKELIEGGNSGNTESGKSTQIFDIIFFLHFQTGEVPVKGQTEKGSAAVRNFQHNAFFLPSNHSGSTIYRSY
jgi:hypothetical protein